MPGTGFDRNHAETFSVDAEENAFITDSLRYFVPIVVNTALSFPCDAILIVGAAGTVQTISVFGAEQRASDTNAGVVALTLACNVWHKMAVSNVSALGGGNAVAGYLRRPEGA